MKLGNLFKNKSMYYVGLLLLLVQICIYVKQRFWARIVVLIGVICISHRFSRNQTTDIFMGLLIANILFACQKATEDFIQKGSKLL